MASVLLFSAIVFTAIAEPQPGCCGKGKAKIEAGCCKSGAACQMGAACKMGPECSPAGMGMGPGGPPPMMMMRGAERDLVTLRGRVVSIDRGPQGGMRMMVESDSRITPVVIRPGWFAGDEIEQVKPNDRVEVMGMQVSREGRSMVMPGKITIVNDQKTITLRRRMEMRDEMPPEMPPPMVPPPPMRPHPKAY